MSENSSFEKELTTLINRHSKENDSDTPDYILSHFVINCLNAWNSSIKLRDKHIGLITHHQLKKNIQVGR